MLQSLASTVLIYPKPLPHSRWNLSAATLVPRKAVPGMLSPLSCLQGGRPYFNTPSKEVYLPFYLPCLHILKEMRGSHFLACARDLIIYRHSSVDPSRQPQRQVASLSKLSLTSSLLVFDIVAPTCIGALCHSTQNNTMERASGRVPRIWHAFNFRKRWFKLCSTSLRVLW